MTETTEPTIPRSAADVPAFEHSEDDEAVIVAAQVLTVENDGTFIAAGEHVRRLKFLKREIEKHYKAQRDPLTQLARTIREMEQADLEDVDTGIAHLEPQIVTYHQAQAQAAEAERRRLEAEATAAAAAEQEQRAQAVERVAQQEPDRSVRSAMKREAKAIRTAPVVAARVNAPAPVKAAGVSVRTRREAEIFDVMALVKAIAEGKVPLDAIEPERLKATHPWLDGMANQLGPNITRIMPGVRVAEKSGVTAR